MAPERMVSLNFAAILRQVCGNASVLPFPHTLFQSVNPYLLS
jgi:hypothetical protein